MKILTLCPKCRDVYSEAFAVKPYNLANATTKIKPACESCGAKGRALEMFIIDSKKKPKGK